VTWRTVRPLWHVYPLDDLREHVTDGPGCWCNPTPDEEEPQLLVHHAMDGREAFEVGERLPS
jgi:hypothetical protein